MINNKQLRSINLASPSWIQLGLAKFGAGFTLVEMLAYVAVLAVVIGAVFSFLLWTAQSQISVHSRHRLSFVATQALELVAKEVREAKSVYEPTSALGSSPGQLSLETQKDLVQGETETYVDFFLCGLQLCMKKEGTVPLALTPPEVFVNSFVVTKVVSGALPSLKIVLALSFQESQFSITQTISLRIYDAP